MCLSPLDFMRISRLRPQRSVRRALFRPLMRRACAIRRSRMPIRGRESSEYVWYSRGGVGLCIGTLWGLALWLLDGAPVRRRSIARICEDVAKARQFMPFPPENQD